MYSKIVLKACNFSKVLFFYSRDRRPTRRSWGRSCQEILEIYSRTCFDRWRRGEKKRVMKELLTPWCAIHVRICFILVSSRRWSVIHARLSRILSFSVSFNGRVHKRDVVTSSFDARAIIRRSIIETRWQLVGSFLHALAQVSKRACKNELQSSQERVDQWDEMRSKTAAVRDGLGKFARLSVFSRFRFEVFKVAARDPLVPTFRYGEIQRGLK